ncbi:MAG TPA: CHAD domain-containing protein, partial [Caulobacteraceae bacterium]|nr:CHAD domain-containing protein [Caulobacteraceae bacterium]
METELKFEVDAAAARRLSENLALSAKGGVRKLRSIYYDTPGADLRTQGYALRIRDDGGRKTQTLKHSGAGMGFRREEWEIEVTGPGPDLDADTPLGEVLNKRDAAQLAPAFEVDVERATRELAVDGGVIEVALDRGVVSAGGAGEPVLELELELKKGSPRALFALARDLSGVAALNLSFASKSGRGYALMDGESLAPIHAVDPALSHGDDAASAFKAIAGAALAQIADNARVLRRVRRIEALHQLRVGARRLRSAISLFKPMLADGRVEHIKTELKWLTHELDDARNLDVFIAGTFRVAARRHGDWIGLAQLGKALLGAQTKAYDRAEAAVSAERFRALLLEAAAWIETGPWSTTRSGVIAALRSRPIEVAARQILSERRKKVIKRGRKLDHLEPHARHQLRIEIKKLRYATGFFGGL